MSTPPPPSWPHCGHGAEPVTDPVGCRGIHVPGRTLCLAHLTEADRTAFLASLAPGADIDHRGTPFTPQLLTALLNALEDPTTNTPHVGIAWFDEAQFSGDARFGRARFSGDAWFVRAQFSGDAGFDAAQFSGDARFIAAQFSGDARFDEAQISGDAWFIGARFFGNARFVRAQFSGIARFIGARFSGIASFDRAQFSGIAWFIGARFSGIASFDRAQFSGDAEFDRAQFSNNAQFDRAQFSGGAGFSGAQFSLGAGFSGARFEGVSVLGPLVCAGRVVLSGVVFVLPVTLEMAARWVVCERTRWESTATVRVRHAAVDLSHAVLTAPTAVIAHPTPFINYGSAVSEALLAGSGPGPVLTDRVRVVSVQGVDAAHLVLTDTDLTECLFSGAFHLDQIRLEGRTTFADAPTGWRRRGVRPVRFTRRRVLAEEHHWRAHTAGPAPHGWHPGPHPTDPAHTPDPEYVAALYRQLRKAFEDGKNEPGAADFYYGECGAA
ncbi:pentapeptide repeat-containing protein [Streptomyces geranii]|uniref:pentapeptide repeat-containing protein n=1 Tax=Streptomyces geranii TaxID=2058923 RepID=UPI000D023CC3|nr:pentapeptide repeat-containing protein [Streptomyces geranii]